MTNTHFFDTEIGMTPEIEVLLEYSVTLNYSWRVKAFDLQSGLSLEMGSRKWESLHSRRPPAPVLAPVLVYQVFGDNQ